MSIGDSRNANKYNLYKGLIENAKPCIAARLDMLSKAISEINFQIFTTHVSFEILFNFQRFATIRAIIWRNI